MTKWFDMRYDKALAHWHKAKPNIIFVISIGTAKQFVMYKVYNKTTLKKRYLCFDQVHYLHTIHDLDLLTYKESV